MALQNNNVLPDETFIAGESKTITIQVNKKNEDGVIVPFDLTLFSTMVKVCPMGEKSYTILSKVGTVDQDPTTGKFSIKLYPNDTQLWDEGYYTFQAIVTQTSDNEYKVEGTWFVRGAIL